MLLFCQVLRSASVARNHNPYTVTMQLLYPLVLDGTLTTASSQVLTLSFRAMHP